MIANTPMSAIARGITLAASFLFEILYRRASGRTFHVMVSQTDPQSAAR